MQDAFYKPHQIKDEVFCIIYIREQMFKPILIGGIVTNFVRLNESSTYYHITPTHVYGGTPVTATLRCVHTRTKKAKDITFTQDTADTKLNWVQQFALENSDYLIDSQHWAVFDSLESAVKMINKLNNSSIMLIASEMQAMVEQNKELSNIIK